MIPWWLLIPQGVSGAIKRRGGFAPFRELAKKGPMALGEAVETSAGRLPFRAIIHVAGINMWWRSSEKAVRNCVQNAMCIATQKNYHSIAFPLIGAGTGRVNSTKALSFMQDELKQIAFEGEVRIVRFIKGK